VLEFLVRKEPRLGTGPGHARKYFNRDLKQVQWIFIVAVLVMLAGFGVIL